MRKGFVYTLFALTVVSFLLLTASIPLQLETQESRGTKIRVDEGFFFTQSTQDDFSRAAAIAVKRSLVTVTNYVINEGEAVDDAEEELLSTYLNGSVDGEEQSFMDGHAMRDWETRMYDEAQDRSFTFNISLTHEKIAMVDPFLYQLNTSFNLTVTDSRTDSRFHRTGIWANITENITDLEDPFILLNAEGRDTNFFQACATDVHANNTVNGTDSAYNTVETSEGGEWESGDAYIEQTGETNTSVSDAASEDRLFVTENACNYDTSADLGSFAGVISEAAVDNTGTDLECGLATLTVDAFVEGADDATTLLENGTRTVMTGDEVWTNHVKQRVENRCYFTVELDGDEQNMSAPTFLGRLENRYTIHPNRSSQLPGIAAFQPQKPLPGTLQESGTSRVDYVYWNDSDAAYGTAWKIKGVTNQEFDWFRIDDVHVQEWGLGSLTFE